MFDLPVPVAAQFSAHAKAPPLGKAPVGKAPVMRPHKQMEEIAAASGGSFRVYGGDADPAKKGAKAMPVFAQHDTIAATDPACPFRAGCRAKIYEVTLTAGLTYQIDMVGDMDPYLFLQDAGGRLVSANDNGGGGMNALITFRPGMTGVYRIIATSAGPGRTGTFAVTVIDRPF
jgi:hypothetical protein